jgi:type IV secretion system protein TrbG
MKTKIICIIFTIIAPCLGLAATPPVPSISEAIGDTAPITVDSACKPTACTSTNILPMASKKPNRSSGANRVTTAFDNKQRVEIAEHIALNSQAPSTARASGSATSYKYQDGQIFIVYAGLERITSIDLEPGEVVTGDIQAGDTVRWMLASVTSGAGANAQQHIIVKPTDAGAITNMLIPTNRRVYMLDLRAVADWYMPSVRFSYPAQDWAKANALTQQLERIEDTTTTMSELSPDSLNFNYKISGRSVRWKPLQVFDDGRHTYIRMPSNLAATDAPALFVIEESEALLVNYRIKGTSDSDSGSPTYIIDRIFDKAELRVGENQKLTIQRR